jgi:hypothetical protein
VKRGIVCATVLGIFSLAACSSETSEPLAVGDPEQAAVVLPERGCAPGEPPGSIPVQICALLPTPMDQAQVTRFHAIEDEFAAGNEDQARSDMLVFIGFLARMNLLGEVEDPNGSRPPSIQRALADLSTSLLEVVGFPDADIPPDAYEEGFVGIVNGDEGGTAIAKNAFYGVQVPAGAFPGEALVVMDPLPNGADPLETDFRQVPKFVEIRSIPAIESFDEPLTVGVCAITDGLTEAQENALRLAHNVGEGVEVLDFVEPPFELDCEALIDEGLHALPAGPGGVRLAATKTKGVGGQVSSFSPFGAVVPGETDTGSIQVLTVTTGPGPEGYQVAVDEDEPLPISPNGSRTFSLLPVGEHTVTLSGLLENCSVEGPNPRPVTVEAGVTTETTFDVTCFGPTGERIVFVSNRDGNPEIYSMNVDGSDVIRLTNDPAVDDTPVLSPDGTKIAFRSFRVPDGDVFVMNADGSNVVNLTNFPAANDGRPSWSPNGSQLCYESGRSGIFNIHRMAANGGSVAQLTESGGFFCSWSPLGDQIAFTSERTGNREVFVMDADGNDETNITNNPAEDALEAWSPDGSKLAFDTLRDGNYEIYVMNPDGSNPVNLTNNPNFDLQPRWLTDGSKIAFQTTRDGNSEIYLMNPNGTGQTNITNNPAQDAFSAF